MNTVEPAEPTTDQLNAWFDVLHRVAQLQFDDPMHKVTAPKPLPQAIRDCVNRGWLMAWDTEEERKADKCRLLIRPEGRAIYKDWCSMLAEAGRPVNPCWVREFDVA